MEDDELMPSGSGGTGGTGVPSWGARPDRERVLALEWCPMLLASPLGLMSDASSVAAAGFPAFFFLERKTFLKDFIRNGEMMANKEKDDV